MWEEYKGKSNSTEEEKNQAGFYSAYTVFEVAVFHFSILSWVSISTVFENTILISA